MNIALYGFMAVGKSTVGRITAESLGFEFVDMDDEIEQVTGRKIHEIFRDSGEATFRSIEKSTVERLASRDRFVIACGGGAVLNDSNVMNLRRNSILVLLTADPKEILRRVEEDDTRPLLNVPDREQQVKALMGSRRPAYEKIADVVIDTSGRSPRQVADMVVSVYRERIT